MFPLSNISLVLPLFSPRFTLSPPSFISLTPSRPTPTTPPYTFCHHRFCNSFTSPSSPHLPTPATHLLRRNPPTTLHLSSSSFTSRSSRFSPPNANCSAAAFLQQFTLCFSASRPIPPSALHHQQTATAISPLPLRFHLRLSHPPFSPPPPHFLPISSASNQLQNHPLLRSQPPHLPHLIHQPRPPFQPDFHPAHSLSSPPPATDLHLHPSHSASFYNPALPDSAPAPPATAPISSTAFDPQATQPPSTPTFATTVAGHSNRAQLHQSLLHSLHTPPTTSLYHPFPSSAPSPPSFFRGSYPHNSPPPILPIPVTASPFNS